MNYFKVYDKRAENGIYYFEDPASFNRYHKVVWSCDHELVFLGLDDITNTLVFKRKED